MLHHDHGGAAFDELVERADDVRGVLCMEACARLVDDEERARGLARERTRELQALRFAARERRERLAERQVAEADLHERLERALEDVVAVLLRREERERLLDRHREHVGDRPSRCLRVRA